MPTATRTFRVFVSSTFEDLKDERNALQEKVFPELVKLCAKRGARFQAVDLRWGVREEAGLDHRTMEICKAEIARCQKTGIKPNFIVLLGDRYGWRPLPAKIIETEFQKVHSRITDSDELAEVETWYDRIDDNAVPPQRLLRPREGVYESQDQWRPVEQRLHRILREVAHKANLPDVDLVKYDASATHQEILAGLGDRPEDREHVFAFFRKPQPPEDPDLAELKKTLTDEDSAIRLPDRNVFEVGAHDLDALSKYVTESLTRVIEDEAKRFQSRTALEQEKDTHRAFAKERSKNFVGRTTVLDEIASYLRGNDGWAVVVHGPSGSGKSAILAKASEDHPGIRRFIGATPLSSSGLTLLRSLCEEIGERYGHTGAVPATFNEIVVMLQDRLRLATPDRPLILYIDALDQLSPQDPTAAMSWLPRELPSHCRVVFSTIDVPATLAGARLIAVAPFSVEEAGKTLNLWLSDAKRKLQDKQRDKLLESFRQSGLPLYLKLAFDEARLWRSIDPIEACVLGDGLPGIIDRLFARLSDPATHGKVLVAHAIGYLTAARYGLTEDEMLAVLAANDEVWKDFERTKKHGLPQEMLAEAGKEKRQLPVILWSRLYLDLEPYLTERAVPGATTISFYHRQIAERMAMRCFQDTDPLLFHLDIARYLETRWRDGDVHAVSELPYHQMRAETWGDLEQTLKDLTFADVKCTAGLIRELIGDYDAALSVLNSARLERPPAEEIGLLRVVLTRFTQVLSDHPQAFFGLLHHEAEGVLLIHCETYVREGWWKKPWIRTDPIAISASAGNARAIALEVHSEYRFGGRHAATLSRESQWAFYLKSLGQIAVIDTALGREFSETVSVRPHGVLSLAASDDAGLLALAFENGEVDVMRLNVASGQHEAVATLPYLLPEFEVPVVRWQGRTLWLQVDRQTITAFGESGVRHFKLPPDCFGELSAVIEVAGAYIVSTRHDRGASLVRISDETGPTVRHLLAVEIVCLDQCGVEQIVCGFSDYSIVILDARTLEEQGRLSLQDLPVCVSGSESAIVWASNQGHLFAWRFRASASAEAMDDKAVLGFGERVLCMAPGHSCTVIATETRIVSFSAAASAHSDLAWPVERVFVLEDGAVALAQRRDGDLWLVDTLNHREARLGPLASGLLAIDSHQHVLGVFSSGSCLWLNWPDLAPSYVPGLPAGIGCVAPAAESGFWLLNYQGALFFLGSDLSLSEVCRIGSHSAQYSRIFAWPDWLLVQGVGVVEEWQRNGAEDTNEFLVFFRVGSESPPKVERYGVRVFLKHEGFVQAAAFDQDTDRLLVVTRRDSDRIVRCRAGSPKAFLNRTESVHDIECRERVTQVARTASGQPDRLLLLHGGILSCFDAEETIPRAVLAVDGPITALASNRRGATVMVESQRRLFRCDVSRGGVPHADDPPRV